MPLDGITVKGISSLVEETNEALRKVTDARARNKLEAMKGIFSDMRVALVELENVEAKHSTGDITVDAYFDRRKKLVRDFYAARDRIADSVVPDLADIAPNPEQSSSLAKFKVTLRENRDLLTSGLNLLTLIVKVFSHS
jgi:hypothetical protein